MGRSICVALLLALCAARPCPGADGDIDASFADGGRLVLSPSDAGLVGYASLAQPDGNVLVAGYRWYVGSMPFDNQVAVWRVLADGRIDPAFGCCGFGMMSFGDDIVLPSGMALDSERRVLISALSGFNVLRFTADGMPDPAFGTSGRAVVDFSDLGYDESFAYAVVEDAAGDIVVVGTVEQGVSEDLVVVRLSASGVPDPTFGNAGRVVIAQGVPGARRSAGLHTVAAVSDGGVYAAGGSTANPIGTWRGFVVLRLRADGTLDRDFATDGVAVFPPQYPAGGDRAQSLFVDRDRLLLAGSCGYGNDIGSGWFCALRLHANGGVDSSYGEAGWAQLAPAPVVRARVSAVLQSDGKVVLAGTTPIGGPTNFAAARLTATGQPDATFGGGSGYVAVSFGTPAGETDDHAAAVSLQAGRIVVVGDTDGVPDIRALAATRLQNDLIFASSFD